MRLRIFMVAGIAFALVPHALAAPAPPMTPPPEWADYVAAVRKADAIVNDEERCLAHPDLPDNQWLPGAAKGRCSMLRAPALSLDQIEALLRTKDGLAELENKFATLLDAHYKDQSQREQIFRAFIPFDGSSRSGEVAARWLKLAPTSAYANAALANYHGDSGWKARGTKLLRDTADGQLHAMQTGFEAAVPLYLKALEIEPRLSPACRGLAAIGRQSSDALKQYAMGICTKVDPDSYTVALERIFEAQPRWGGSDAELRAAVAYAAARVDRNPILAALVGEAAGDALSMADDFGDVVDELTAVARMAPSGTILGNAGHAHLLKNDYWTAFAYSSQALRFWPRDANYRGHRAQALWKLRDYDWAQNDARIALEVDPNNGWNQFRMGLIAADSLGASAALPYFKRAMEFPGTRSQGLSMYCFHLLATDLVSAAAADCTRDLVEEYPKSGEAWRMRAVVLHNRAEPGAMVAFENFLQYAEPNKPSHQDIIPLVRQWKAEWAKKGVK